MIRLALLLSLIAAPAQAAEMAFYVKNWTMWDVVVELASRDRDKIWPGGEQMYLIQGGERKSVPVECVAGERICYGAWIHGDAGTHWGIGPDRDLECDDCCTICTEGSTKVISITR